MLKYIIISYLIWIICCFLAIRYGKQKKTNEILDIISLDNNNAQTGEEYLRGNKLWWAVWDSTYKRKK